MTNIINNDSRPAVEREVRVEDNSTGWAVAVIVLLIVIAGGVWAWTHYRRGPAAPAASPNGTNINVSVPTSSTGGNSSGQ